RFIIIDLVYFSFFFSSRRRHTRFSRDWSSDVCSSDLESDYSSSENRHHKVTHLVPKIPKTDAAQNRPIGCAALTADQHVVDNLRSEERRVGKECKSRWSPYSEKKKKKDDR